MPLPSKRIKVDTCPDTRMTECLSCSSFVKAVFLLVLLGWIFLPVYIASGVSNDCIGSSFFLDRYELTA